MAYFRTSGFFLSTVAVAHLAFLRLCLPGAALCCVCSAWTAFTLLTRLLDLLGAYIAHGCDIAQGLSLALF